MTSASFCAAWPVDPAATKRAKLRHAFAYIVTRRITKFPNPIPTSPIVRYTILSKLNRMLAEAAIVFEWLDRVGYDCLTAEHATARLQM